MPAQPPATPVLVIADGIFPDPDRIAAAYGQRAELRYADVSDPGQTGDADALVVSTQTFDAARLEALPERVRLLSRSGVGLDAIDLETCARLGITVVNQPTYGAVEVAGHAAAMVFMLQRRLQESDAYVRQGWSGPFSLAPMPPLDELTLGLVGCGRIGAEMARLAAPFVDRVLAYDPYAPTLPPGVTGVDSLDGLLAQSHLLSLHTPLTQATRGLIGRRELELLPPHAIVVNVARGGILDEAAAAALLVDGRLGGLGLDVFATEPLPNASPLHGAPRTMLTPHVAAYSERSSWRLASWAIEDACAWLATREIRHGAVAVSGSR